MSNSKSEDSDLFGPWLEQAVDKLRTELLQDGWPEYLRLVDKLESHPQNRHGADKSWVERVLCLNRQHYRRAVRVHCRARSEN